MNVLRRRLVTALVAGSTMSIALIAGSPVPAADGGAMYTVTSTLGLVAAASGATTTSSPPASPAPGSPTTAVADPTQLVTNAATGYRTFIAAFEGAVFEDEDSIKVGECPVIDVDGFNALMSGLGLAGPYEAESGGELELFDAPVIGSPLRPVGVFCDLDVSDDLVTNVESASVSVVDHAMHPEALPLLQPIVDAGGIPATATAGFVGDAYTVCGEPFFDDSECAVVWFGSELVVALSIEYASVPDPAATATAFGLVLPAVLQQLADLA